MQTDHSKLIRGLNIAVIAFSAIAIIGCVIALIALGIGNAFLNEYGTAAIHHSMNQLDYSASSHMHDYYYDYYYDDDFFGLASMGVIFGAIAVVWELVMGLVALVAGILGVLHAQRVEKLGSVFGWGIAGAIAALLAGRFITMVLLIISAIYANKDKNFYAAYAAYAQSCAQPYAQPAAGYGQPYNPSGAQPCAQPYAQPAPAPYDQQAVTYAQPFDPYAQPTPSPYDQTYAQPVTAAPAAANVPAEPTPEPSVEATPNVPVEAEPVEATPIEAAPVEAETIDVAEAELIEVTNVEETPSEESENSAEADSPIETMK